MLMTCGELDAQSLPTNFGLTERQVILDSTSFSIFSPRNSKTEV